MSNEKFLLYIDLLGFSDYVENNHHAMGSLFKQINQLSSFQDEHFKTIVFSDTILVFNILDYKEDEFFILRFIEIVKELLHTTRTIGLQFRALVTKGQFIYEQHSNIESYYGMALINSYKKEKNIQGMGLFIDKKISLNTIPHADFDDDFNFVYLFRELELFEKNNTLKIPIDASSYLNKGGKNLSIASTYLCHLHLGILGSVNSSIRVKYLQTYELYRNRYPDLIAFLENNSFQYNLISPNVDWDDLAINLGYL